MPDIDVIFVKCIILFNIMWVSVGVVKMPPGSIQFENYSFPASGLWSLKFQFFCNYLF